MKQVAGELFRRTYQYFLGWRNFTNSIRQAQSFRKIVIEHKGGTCVTRGMIADMKREMKMRFGKAGHWPWIALYTELRGEYIKGWVPDDFYAYKMLPRFNPHPGAKLSTIKSFDHRLFPGFAVEPLLIRVNRVWFDSKMNRRDPRHIFQKLRAKDQEIVIKRDGSPSGLEINFIRTSELSLDLFLPGKDYLIQPSVKQHVELAKLYDKSINTLRLTTFIKKSGEIEIKHRSLRFGVAGNRIVNVSKGGLCVILDNKGKVITQAMNDIGTGKGTKHPDTGYSLADLQVPSIAEAEQRCKKAHLTFPYIRFIAWDLYIDEESKPKMIEWNAMRPDMWVNEALIGPLWGEEIGELGD